MRSPGRSAGRSTNKPINKAAARASRLPKATPGSPRIRPDPPNPAARVSRALISSMNASSLATAARSKGGGLSASRSGPASSENSVSSYSCMISGWKTVSNSIVYRKTIVKRSPNSPFCQSFLRPLLATFGRRSRWKIEGGRSKVEDRWRWARGRSRVKIAAFAIFHVPPSIFGRQANLQAAGFLNGGP